jgi:ribosome-associated toxin RatA of RatAB toxin-antitoxin module
MHRVNEITIDADVDTTYNLAANVERWPALLPHYRAVEVRWLEEGGRRLVARMDARRGALPVSWVCWLERDPHEPRLAFRHIGGFTRGMRVAWTFETRPDGRVVVRITHDFSKGWWPAALDRLVSDKIVGGYFVHAIATRTLAMLKLLAEAERAAHADLCDDTTTGTVADAS